MATRALREPREGLRGRPDDLMADLMTELITEWVEMFCLDTEFEAMFRKLASLSNSLGHLNYLTNAVEQKVSWWI